MVPRITTTILALASLTTAQAQPTAKPFDLILAGGSVIDGSGAPGFPADVAIRRGRIVALGDLSGAAAVRRIDVSGLCVAPGFIDTHAHADSVVVRRPRATNFVRMGVTTIVTGNCGGSMADLGRHFASVHKRRVSINYASLIGHNTVRRAILGTKARAPTTAELAQMEELVDKAMRAGAMGLSTGLIYVPGSYAKTDEIIALAKVVRRHGGLYATHMRNEGKRVIDAIDEALRIGAAADIAVHLSHLKASGKNNWGRGVEIIERMKRARASGRRVTGDQYAYTASSTGIDVLFPTRELSVGRKAFAKRLDEDAPFRAKMKSSLLRKMARVGFGDFEYCQVSYAKHNTEINGKNLKQVAEAFYGKSGHEAQADAAIKLYADSRGEARVAMVYHKMSELDVATIMRAPFVGVACDAGIRALKGVSKPHPRGNGNNARVLSRYVREKRVISLPFAVQKMTQLPARIFGLTGRGEIRIGNHADLTVFDAKRVRDRASYTEPRLHPDGIPLVLVNGVIVVENGAHTGARPGQVLLRTTRDAK